MVAPGKAVVARENNQGIIELARRRERTHDCLHPIVDRQHFTLGIEPLGLNLCGFSTADKGQVANVCRLVGHIRLVEIRRLRRHVGIDRLIARGRVGHFVRRAIGNPKEKWGILVVDKVNG